MRGCRLLLAAAAALLLNAGVHPARATACYADTNNLVANCSFEDGSYTSGPDGEIPDGWNPVGNYITALDGVNPGANPATAHTGSYYAVFDNFENQGLAGISQTISDVAGQSYILSFWLQQNGDNSSGQQTFQAAMDGTVEYTSGPAVSNWHEITLDLTGTGSDTIQFEGFSENGNNVLDDVSFDGPAPVKVPEPMSLALLAPALLGLGVFRRRQRSLN